MTRIQLAESRLGTLATCGVLVTSRVVIANQYYAVRALDVVLITGPLYGRRSGPRAIHFYVTSVKFYCSDH